MPTARDGGVIGMTRSVALDCVKQGFRCNVICPGTVEGQKPPVYFDVGDTMTLAIDGLGQQTQTVVKLNIVSVVD